MVRYAGCGRKERGDLCVERERGCEKGRCREGMLIEVWMEGEC